MVCQEMLCRTLGIGVLPGGSTNSTLSFPLQLMQGTDPSTSIQEVENPRCSGF